MRFFSSVRGVLCYAAFLGIGIAGLVIGHTAARIVSGVIVVMLVAPALVLAWRFANRDAKPS